MRAHIQPREAATIDINHLQIGGIYEAITQAGHVMLGEYLGIEVAYDDRRILLRGRAGTDSIIVDHLTSVA
jgi:phage-related protein